MTTAGLVNVCTLKEALKNSQVKESDLQSIREWCQKQAHLPKMEDIYLVLCLHSNYHRLEPTKTTIENFCTARTHMPEFFGNRNPFLKELREQSSVAATIPLKGKSKEGHHLFYSTLIDPEASHFYFFDCLKVVFMITEVSVLAEGPTNGLDYVFDVKNVSLAHIGRMHLMGLKKILFYIQEAAPVRLKHIHVLNHNAAIETLLNLCKPFMKKELYNIIRFHNSLQSLEEYVSIDLLPNCSGGKAGNVEDLQMEQLKLLEENREWFRAMESTIIVNESLRVGKPTSSSDLFGIDGSFKKLDID